MKGVNRLVSVSRPAALFVLKRYRPVHRSLKRFSLYAQLTAHLRNILRRVQGKEEVGIISLYSAYYRKRYFTAPIEADLVVLDCFWGRKVGGNPYAIYREICRDPSQKWRFVWVKNKGVKAPRDVEENDAVMFVTHGSKAYAAALLKARLLICNSNFAPFFARREGQYVIHTWHGIPLKKLGLEVSLPVAASLNTQRNFHQSTLIPLASDYSTRRIVRAYGASLALGKVRVTGSPRIDLMLNANVSRVKELLGVPEHDRIVLYAPTWRGIIGSVSTELEDQLEAINVIRQNLVAGQILFVSLHHLTRKALGVLPCGIRYVPDELDINEFMSAVDVLVSDYSSIFIDYLVLDRPIVLYVPDLQEYQGNRGLLVDIDDLPVSLARNLPELRQNLQDPPKPSNFESYNRYIELWLPNEDGFASKRVWEIVRSDQPRESVAQNKKRILLYSGQLANNGITKSLLNLLRCHDNQEYEFHVAFNAGYGNPGQDGFENIRKVMAHAEIVLVSNPSSMTLFESYSRWCQHSHFSESKIASNVRIGYYQYEARRLFGDCYFDVAIDFTGYSFFWSSLLVHTNAGVRLIYLHSDMAREVANADRGMGQLKYVFANYRFYDYLVSVSEACNQENRTKLARYICGKAQAVALPNVLDVHDIRSCAEKAIDTASPQAADFLRKHEGETCFIAVGRLSPEKNLVTLLEGFARLHRGDPKASLILVGDGTQREDLQNQVNLLGIEHAVCFTGHVSNPYPLIAAADCLVFPSQYEGQGLVLLEALTLGTMCIASDIPAAREILSEYGGYLIPPTVDELYRAMQRYHQNRPKVRPFDAEEYARKAVERFGGLIGQKPVIPKESASTLQPEPS